MEETLIDNIEKEWQEVNNSSFITTQSKAIQSWSFVWDLIRYNKQLEERVQQLEKLVYKF